MRLLHRWTDKTRLLVQIALLACCVSITIAVRSIVAVDTLSDSLELALNSTALVAVLASSAWSFLMMRATQARRMRAWSTATAMLLVGVAVAFIRFTYADASIELADLIEPAQAAEGSTQIVVGPTGDDVRLTGDIREGAASLLENILAAHPAIQRIHLTSDGGLAEEGQALADVIAAHRLTTYVPDYCVSACTLAFVGGRERIMMDGARLGFHAPFEEGVLGQTFAGDAKDQRAAYLKAGLAADFVDAALKVSPDDLWIPEKPRLLAAHVANGYVDRYRFPDSILDGVADGQGARDAVLRNFALLKGINAASPQTVDSIAGWYLRAYRRGASEGEATDGLKTIIGATVTLVLGRADDATLLDLGRLLQAAMRTDRPGRECAAIGESVDLVRAATVLSKTGKDVDTVAEDLIARALASERKPQATSSIMPVAFVPRDETCASLQQAYADAVRHRDPSALRRRLQEQAAAAARLLAPIVAAKF